MVTENNNKPHDESKQDSIDHEQTTNTEKAVSETTSIEATKTPPSGRALASLALIVALAATGGSAYLWYQNRTWQQSTDAGLNEIRALALQQNSTLQQLTEASNQNRAIATEQQAGLQQMQQSMQQLAVNSSANARLLTLTDVAHLILTAKLSMQYNRDINGAIALLTAARDELQSANDTTLIPLLQSVTNNLMALKSVTPVNLSDIVSRLTAVNNALAGLPLIKPNFTAATTTNTGTGTATTTQEKWLAKIKAAWQTGWDSLKKLVVVQRESQPIRPLVSPEERDLINKNIQFLIGQAQWAALRNDQQLYAFSLKQALQIIKQYYILQHPASQAVLSQIATLQTINVAPALPDLSTTEAVLKSLLNEKTSMPTTNATPAPVAPAPTQAPTTTPPTAAPTTPVPPATTTPPAATTPSPPPASQTPKTMPPQPLMPDKNKPKQPVVSPAISAELPSEARL